MSVDQKLSRNARLRLRHQLSRTIDKSQAYPVPKAEIAANRPTELMPKSAGSDPELFSIY